METKVPSAPTTRSKWPPCLTEAAFPDNRNYFSTWVNHQVDLSINSLKVTSITPLHSDQLPLQLWWNSRLHVKKKKLQISHTTFKKEFVCICLICLFTFLLRYHTASPCRHTHSIYLLVSCFLIAQSTVLGHVVISYCHRITELLNQLGWKRSLRPWSSTYDLKPPCHLYYGTKCFP